MQSGTIQRKGPSWYVKFRENVVVDGQLVRRQKMMRLCAYGPHYRHESDVRELAAERLALVKKTDKRPVSTGGFNDYVEQTYLPWAKESKKASTFAAYQTYFKRYVRPYTDKLALRDFDISKVAEILEAAAAEYHLNLATTTKVRSVMSAIFAYAISKGHFPARSEYDNPAHGAGLPLCAQPEATVVATDDQVRGILTALKDMPLERAAVALIAMTGIRPGEARGLKWADWERSKEQLQVRRSIWHTHEGTPKTAKSLRAVAVTPELRAILQELWKAQGSPFDGYVLAGINGRPTILDNLAKRSIRDALKAAKLSWPGWYALRRHHGTAVREESSADTVSRALGNSAAVADRHYIKPVDVLPDVRKAVAAANKKLGS
jgi:integrase